MGFNSTIVIMNDSLHAIAKDKEFGKKVHDAILQHASTRQRVDIPSGCCVNAAHVVDCTHADQSSLILVGGNLGRKFDKFFGNWRMNPKTDEGAEEILRQLADQYGFRLSKKPQKKG